MITQHNMGVAYAMEFANRLDSGELLTEEGFLEGLKSVYVEVGKCFYGQCE